MPRICHTASPAQESTDCHLWGIDANLNVLRPIRASPTASANWDASRLVKTRLTVFRSGSVVFRGINAIPASRESFGNFVITSPAIPAIARIQIPFRRSKSYCHTVPKEDKNGKRKANFDLKGILSLLWYFASFVTPNALRITFQLKFILTKQSCVWNYKGVTYSLSIVHRQIRCKFQTTTAH